MREDSVRTEAYRKVIWQRAPGCVCLDIGTGAEALLAIMAAQAGAAHVYAIEANPSSAERARHAVRDAGLCETVSIIDGYSTSVSLPQCVDLLIHEIIGEVAGIEGVVVAILDAKARHLCKQAVMPLSIPARARTLLAPIGLPGPDFWASLRPPVLASPAAKSLRVPAPPPSAVILADAAVFEDLRFEEARPAPSQLTTLRFELDRPGTSLWALVLHTEVFVADGDAAEPEISAARAGSHWPTVLLPLPRAVELVAPQMLEVRCVAELAGPQPRYEFEVVLEGPLGRSQRLPPMRFPDD